MIYTRSQETLNMWNIIFSALFVVIAYVCIRWVESAVGYFPQGIEIFDVVLLALATLRLTRLIVYDKIMRFFRELFMKKE